MPLLPEQPTLRDYQQFVLELEKEHGFSHETVMDKCLLLGEEMGELFKAIRKRVGIKIERDIHEVSHELADIIIYLCAIANRYDIDLETAFRDKGAINQLREWK